MLPLTEFLRMKQPSSTKYADRSVDLEFFRCAQPKRRHCCASTDGQGTLGKAKANAMYRDLLDRSTLHQRDRQDRRRPQSCVYDAGSTDGRFIWTGGSAGKVSVSTSASQASRMVDTGRGCPAPVV
jgi:hypothetical protein